MKYSSLFIFSTKTSKIYLITRLYSHNDQPIFHIHFNLLLSFEGKFHALIPLIIDLPSKFL